jgi:hypothetical protein
MGRSWFRTAKVSIGMSRFAVTQNTPGAPADVSIRKGVWGIPLNTEPTFCEAVRPIEWGVTVFYSGGYGPTAAIGVYQAVTG